MAKIAIIYCKKIKDHSCIACAKCFKGMAEKNGEFARHDEIELVAMTDCGDCPGLVVPRVKLLKDVLPALGREVDCVHLGSCVKAACLTAQCPINLDKMKAMLESKFNVQVVVGTHSY
jgi:predicted metal-binding protein